MTKKVYLAGPEVFLPNAREMLDRKAALAREAGLIPLSPGDLEIPHTNSKRERAAAINAVDEKMMIEADAIIANLTPFRGIAADTGTAFELGFMCASGKPVFAYTNVARDHSGRVSDLYGGPSPMMLKVDCGTRTELRSRISAWPTISCCTPGLSGAVAS